MIFPSYRAMRSESQKDGSLSGPFSRFIQSFFKLNAIAKKNSRCFVKRLGFTSNCKASASSVGVPLYSGISSDSKAATFSRIESGGICHSSVSDFSNSQTRRSSLMPQRQKMMATKNSADVAILQPVKNKNPEKPCNIKVFRDSKA